MLNLGLAVPVLFLMGCPPQLFGECQFLNDCPLGEQCQDNTCVPVGIINPVDPPVPFSDAGPNNNNNRVAEVDPAQLEEPQTISWMSLDPRAGGQALFPEYEPGQFDLLRVFAINDGSFVPAFEIDFNNNLGGCALDTLTRQVLEVNELWIACGIGAPARFLNEDDLTQSFDVAGVSVQLVYPTPGVQDVERRLLAARGGPAFVSWQMNDGEDASSSPARLRDNIDPSLSFSAIGSFHAVNAGNVPGDHVLIFDRGANRMVPITLNGTTWEPSPNLAPLALPAGTHAVVFIDTVNANNVPSANGVANLAVLVPSEGRMRFFNYEEGVELDDPGTLFEPNPGFQAAAPDATERILLAKTPSGDAVMYAPQTFQRVYRIPLRSDADDDVRTLDLEPLTRRVSGMVVASEDEVWLTYGVDPTGPAVERVLVDEIP